MKKIAIAIFVIAFIGCIWFVTFSNQQTLKVRVNKVDKIEKVSGSKKVLALKYTICYTLIKEHSASTLMAF